VTRNTAAGDPFTHSDTAIPADILFDIALDLQHEWRDEDREWIRDDTGDPD
jgi:hypothetical protein